MNNENAFSYTYSAKENQEVLDIRKKYLPPPADKLEELKRLDHLVQNSGTTAGLCVGTVGMIFFGLGMCFAMKVIGQTTWLGVLLGLVGLTDIIAAFPIYRHSLAKAKAKYAPRILQLANELSGNIQ